MRPGPWHAHVTSACTLACEGVGQGLAWADPGSRHEYNMRDSTALAPRASRSSYIMHGTHAGRPRIPIPESRAQRSHSVVAGPPAAPNGSGGLGGVHRGRRRSSAACSMQFRVSSMRVVKFDRIRSHDAWGAQVNFPPGASSPLGVFVNVPKEVRNSRKHAGALRGSVWLPFSGVSTGPVWLVQWRSASTIALRPLEMPCCVGNS